MAAAILAGDRVTGVTAMRMDEGVDTGPLLAWREEPIRPDDTRQSLTLRLARLAAGLILEVLPPYLAGSLIPRPQPEEGVTYCRMLSKADGRLDWSRPAAELERQVRAMYPWPGAFTTWEGKRLKVIRAAARPEWRGEEPAGTVLLLDGGPAVAAGGGALRLLEVQLAGRRPMSSEDFLRGQHRFPGARLGV